MFTFLSNTKSDQQTADALATQLHSANKDYRVGKPSISDQEYDSKVEDLRQLDSEHPYLHMVEAEPLGSSNYTHEHPMLSTQKAYSRAEIQSWLSAVKAAAEQCGEQAIIRATTKLDGVACKFVPGFASDMPILATRGNGAIGNVCTSLLKKGLKIIGDADRECVGEIVVPTDYFNAYLSNDFSHPRSFVAGVVNADNLSDQATATLIDGALHLVSTPV